MVPVEDFTSFREPYFKSPSGFGLDDDFLLVVDGDTLMVYYDGDIIMGMVIMSI